MAWVSTSPLVKTYTLEEFWELPDPPDRSKLELIAGVLYMTPPPGPSHNNTVSRLLVLFHDYLRESGDKGRLYVPRAGIMKGPNSWLEPDLFYVTAETNTLVDPIYGHPTTADLVIEVISPGSAIYDRNTKADTYAALAVKELWLIDETLRCVEVRVLKGDRFAPSFVLESDDRMRSELLPGFTVKVAQFFDD